MKRVWSAELSLTGLVSSWRGGFMITNSDARLSARVTLIAIVSK